MGRNGCDGLKTFSPSPEQVSRYFYKTLTKLSPFFYVFHFALHYLPHNRMTQMKNDLVLPQPVPRGKTPASTATPELPLWGAFVVQLSTEADVTQGQWVGRVEHVRSGHATHFQSLDDLLTFITRVLADMRARAGDEP
jgi:hypothetical protein